MKIKNLKSHTCGKQLQNDIVRAVRKHRDNGRHRRIIQGYRAAYPLCQKCQVNATEEIHHIKEVSQGGETDEANLLALCKECHKAIDALDIADQLLLKRDYEMGWGS